MHELLDALATPLRALACAAADAHVSAHPRGFELYAVPLPEAELRAVVRDWEVDDWDWLCGEVRGLAVAHLRTLQSAGTIDAVTVGATTPAWRAAARGAAHPLVRLLADAEFGGARTDEVTAALAAAAALPGADPERPILVRTAV
ncbi:hypothetical protein [Nannocystis punicea]|uniref:PucR family transcriptional regulator n=1 Tax=Nannocystis punicea TaxID=2995304 RepID=A0ABY7GU68_9BACT|nr:hypothetical protein [Nannocystis poenicansa]WAS90509.1 hypothetical protein O0S08_30340 [Nannocystis poenicansa]